MSEEGKKNSFVFYESWYEGAKYLKGKHRLSYLEAIINYGLYGEEVETKGVENALFCAIKPTIKFNRKQKANGLQGGGTEGNSNASKTTQKRPKNDPNPTIFINDKDKDLYIDKKKEEEDKGKSSVVDGLVDFLSNWWDVRLTPAQIALIESKPADYWEHFKDEIEASKWLKQQNLGKVFAMHRNVVDGQYRSFNDNAPLNSSQPQPNETNDEFVIRIAWQALTEQEKKDYMDTHDGKTLIETKGAI